MIESFRPSFRILCGSCLLLPLLHSYSPAAAADQPPAKDLPTALECRWAPTPIKIDGKSDDEAWKHAQVIDHFYVPWLGKNARKAKTATKARLLWDAENIYFFADMEDGDLYADVTEHDGMCWDNDVFELFFKPADDKPGYYEFQVNAAGTMLDMFIPRRGSGAYKRYKSDGKFHVEAKVVLRGTLNKWTDKDQGWSVEGKIPWKDFARSGGRPETNAKWKFALCRYDYSVDFEGPELSTCAPLSVYSFHHFEDYATLRFVGPEKKSAARPYGIDKRVPLTTSKVVGSPDPPPPYRAHKTFADLKIVFPIAVAHESGSDRLLLIHQSKSSGASTISRIKDDSAAKELETLLTLEDAAYDLTFHPDFKNNGYIFVGSNGPQSAASADRRTRVTRYTMDRKEPCKIEPKSAKVIIEWWSDGHNGGAVAFGHDGMLYITSGDGTSDSDTKIVGQDMSTLLAKVLRIDADHPDPDKNYAVPKDNPFLHLKDARPEIWAYGLRNPWRMTVDRKTGHVWVAQNGQDLWEQAFLVKKGDNYGWSVTEGSHPFYPNRKLGPTPLVKPTVEHHHTEARSLTGGIVYYGSKFPELQGAYIYGDYSTGKIWGVRHDGTKILWHKELADTRLPITGFGADSKGEILICDFRGPSEGGLYTFEPTPKDLTPATFPRKLSGSGLFKSVKGHVMAPGLIHYSVNAPLWGDNAFKERWIGLPGAESRIEFTTSRGWNFPDETVIVKSFGLELEEGNPASRRWIETRFLTRQKGEWFGYSYAWNDEQTEGTLVDAKGLDREFVIKTPQSERKQTWHYPSRTECMVCHSRAANWVLGLTELQMNKVHDYGAVQDNQLWTLEHIGVLKVERSAIVNALRDDLKRQGKSKAEIDEYVRQQTAKPNNGQTPLIDLLRDRRLVDPYDPKEDLTMRARSYLHSNCAQCHVEAGGGNAQIDLEFKTPLDKMKIIDVKPQHDSFGLADARLIAPGKPESSVLLHRMACRGRGQMPPLATSLVDQAAVEMLRAWVQTLKVETVTGGGRLRFINPESAPSSDAVVVPESAPLLHTMQLLPLVEGKIAGKGQPAEQVDAVLRRLRDIVKEHRGTLEQVVKINVYAAREDVLPELDKALARLFPVTSRPALSQVITPLPHADALVAVDAVIALPSQPDLKEVKRSAGGAVLPAGTRLFVSGQAEKGTLAEATCQTLDSLRRTLQFLKARDADVVQLKAFVQPMTEIAVVQEELKKFFGDNVPPASFVEWKSSLPIEIELIVWGGRERAGEPIEYLTPPGMKASPVYSRVARVNYGKLIYVSGLHARDAGGPRAEVHAIFGRLGKILEEAGSDYRHLAKATYYVTSADAVKAMGELRPKYYDPQRPPAASLAVVAGTGSQGNNVTLDMIAVPSPRIRPNDYGPPEYGHGLSEQDALDGWISLFDGKTSFGWTDGKVDGSQLIQGATTVVLGDCELKAQIEAAGILVVGGKPHRVTPGPFALSSTGRADRIQLDKGAALSRLLVRPLRLPSLFNGKDLDGWKAIHHPRLTKEQQPTWTVEDGLLHTTGGPGAMEYQNKQFGDLVLQVEARTHVRFSNGGLFFRSQPGLFMQGYEAQIYHRCHDGDGAKPYTWATGAIDDRQNARRLLSRDGQFFVLTVIARGPHLATWVNGHQVTDWTDTRPKHENPRQGLRLEAGTIQLQAHDAGTDLEFRRIAAVKW